MNLEPLYTTTVRVAGARIVHSDGRLDGIRPGTSPEQLLAASYAACVHRTLCLLTADKDIDMRNVVIHAHFTCRRNEEDGSPLYEAHVDVDMPGVCAELAAMLMKSVEEICPYAKMARNGILANVLQAA